MKIKKDVFDIFEKDDSYNGVKSALDSLRFLTWVKSRLDPVKVFARYHQSSTGSAIKHGIGQSIMHTLCEDFHFVYYLFHDQNKDKKIQKSFLNDTEKFIIEKMWKDFNVFIALV